VLAVRSLFAYERLDERKLVVAAGLAREWTHGEGIRVRVMPTLYGPLTYSARTLDEHTFRCDIRSAVAASLELRPPLSGRIIDVTVNGNTHEDFDAQSVMISNTPAEILCRVGSPA
jgi:hypothetical protein